MYRCMLLLELFPPFYQVLSCRQTLGLGKLHHSQNTKYGIIDCFFPYGSRRADCRSLEWPVVASVVNVAFMPFGDQRIPARSTADNTAVGVEMALDAIHSLSRENRLDLLEEGHRYKRIMITFERLAGFQNPNKTDVERIPQNSRKAIESYFPTIPIAQAPAEHFACELRQ